MASEVRSFDVTIPAGTAADSPASIATSFPPRVVTGLQVKVPPGPSGLVGFRFTMAGNPVMPRNVGAWIITDNEAFSWPLTNLPESGEWVIEGYNTDIYDHTIYVTYLLDQITAQGAVTPAESAASTSNAILASSGSISG